MKHRKVTISIFACMAVLGWVCVPTTGSSSPYKALEKERVFTGLLQSAAAQDLQPTISDAGPSQDGQKANPPAPRLVSLRLNPARPVTGDTLRAEVTVEGGSPDADLVVIHWNVNGQDKEETGQVLERPVKYGDAVSVTAELEGSNGKRQMLSTYVLVQNAPPIIRVARASMNAEEYVVELATEDPENDAVALRLTQAPEDMLLDPASKTLHWRLGPDRTPGVYQVVVEGTDAVGNVAQYQFDVTLSPP